MNKVNSSFLQKSLNTYLFTALILLSTLIGLVLLNAVLFVVFMAKNHLFQNPVSRKYNHSNVSSLYPDWSAREIDDLLKETWSRPYVYEPFTEFKESPYRGRYVNVDTNGFRFTKNQGTWPPQSSSFNIFLFGGSTTFGYGVPDNQTIASHLQEYLTTNLGRDVRVYNFGRGHYYSSQERVLYEHLLISGFVPDLTIFIDGINDFYYNKNEPLYTNRLRAFVSPHQSVTNRRVLISLISETSFGRAARGLYNRLPALIRERESSKQLNELKDGEIGSKGYSDPVLIDQVIERYLANKKSIKAVSSTFGVKPIFVWQPSPTYNYDQRYHIFAERGYGQHSYSRYGYERMAKLISEEPPGSDFLWCADIQNGLKEPLYVDLMHYSPSFSKLFATIIADLLVEQYYHRTQSEHSAVAHDR